MMYQIKKLKFFDVFLKILFCFKIYKNQLKNDELVVLKVNLYLATSSTVAVGKAVACVVVDWLEGGCLVDLEK